VPTSSESGSNTARQAATAEAGDDAIHIRQILDDFEPGRGIACDERVILEGMDKGAVHGDMPAVGQGLPALIERSFDNLSAQTAHGIGLGRRSRIDHEDFAGHTSPASSEGHALGSVAGTDSPHTLPPLLFGEQPNRVPGSTNFE
jgi:hypothetical protein